MTVLVKSHVHNVLNMSASSQAAHAKRGPDAAECSASPAPSKGHGGTQALSAQVFQTLRNQSGNAGLEPEFGNPSAPQFPPARTSE